MNKEIFKERYADEWGRLEKNKDFMHAYESDDFAKATEIAAEELWGHARSKAEHEKLKFNRYIEKEYR